MSKQLFTNKNAQRGSAIVSIPMYKLYALMFGRLNLIRGIDPDAVCQQICVEIEKQQGTYPNIEPARAPRISAREYDINKVADKIAEGVPLSPLDETMREMDEDLQSLVGRGSE